MIDYPTALLINVDEYHNIRANRLHYGTYPEAALNILNEFYDEPMFAKDLFSSFMSNYEIREIFGPDFNHLSEESLEFPIDIRGTYGVEEVARILAAQHSDIEYIYIFEENERIWRQLLT